MAGESLFERVAQYVKLSLYCGAGDVDIMGLGNISGIGERVYRAREDAISTDEGDTLNVFTVDNAQRSFSDQIDDNELTIGVSIYVRGDVWESKADIYAVQVHRRVLGYNYHAQGIAVAPARLTDQDWNGEGGDSTPGKRTLKFAFRFLTLRTDIAAQP